LNMHCITIKFVPWLLTDDQSLWLTTTTWLPFLILPTRRT
jgi:hypothetical protein